MSQTTDGAACAMMRRPWVKLRNTIKKTGFFTRDPRSCGESESSSCNPSPVLSFGLALCFASLASPIEAQLDYTLSIEDRLVPPQGEEFEIDVILDSTQGSDVNGWGYGVCHDSAALQVLSVEAPESIVALNGFPPWVEIYELYPDGHAVAVVLIGTGFYTPFPPSVGSLTTATYTHSLPAGSTTELFFCETLGAPPFAIGINVGGSYFADANIDSGELTVLPDDPWIRGDANDDGAVDLGDGIFLLNELLLGGSVGNCFAAKDANADQVLDLSDALFIFDALFLGGASPPPPFPECGALAEDCDSQTSCR